MSTESANHKGPLSGFRVLELAMWHAGPTAACMLADLGAEVIKIEFPQGGDPVRGLRVVYGQSAELPNGVAALFEAYNRNKKSITCDLKNLRGQELVYRLAHRRGYFHATSAAINSTSRLWHNQAATYPASMAGREDYQ